MSTLSYIGLGEFDRLLGKRIMNAVQRIALVELDVPLIAVATVFALRPFLGEAAMAGFAFLGFLGLTPLMMRGSGEKVVSDERDHDIDFTARFWAFGAAWMFLFASLGIVVMWHAYQGTDIPITSANLLLWMQFAICYAVKGGIALRLYGGHHRAT
ncbi:MAG: hypothetical protein AAF989_04755 [Planctomycetota bacterium]